MMITTRPTIQIPRCQGKLSLLRSRNNGSRSMVLVGQLLELVRVERVRARSLKDHSIWVIL